jgi:hypothetical protein
MLFASRGLKHECWLTASHCELGFSLSLMHDFVPLPLRTVRKLPSVDTGCPQAGLLEVFQPRRLATAVEILVKNELSVHFRIIRTLKSGISDLRFPQ